MGKAVKIIDVDKSGHHFELKEDALYKIFASVPEDMPVAIVGVVGAFRTGKSFLLDFFLRYLKNTNHRTLDDDFSIEDTELEWMTAGGNLEGGNTGGEGFKWKAGEDRCTTGIWLWNEYFKRKDPVTNKTMAVFLMDTQGMYDHETSQHLTASIFGLSALLSSYTVFNLMFQIQEDHLQNLALFSEYGRVALKEASSRGKHVHPFQKLEFLVRDFGKLSRKKDLQELQEDMSKYLEKVMSSNFQKDLKEVRDQVELCYEQISCYCLPHPGHEVSEIDGEFNESGDVSTIRDLFKRLLGDYVRRVFNDRITVKRIQGEKMNALKLFEFVKVYCKLFQESKIFPEAMTLFRATQEANIAYAVQKSLTVYKQEMDKFVGVGATFKKEEEISKVHKAAVQEAILEYEANTKIGSEKVNEDAQVGLLKEIKIRYVEYQESNRLRDPLAFVAPYIIPLIIAVVAYIFRYVLNTVCPRRSYACLDFADFFGSVYTVIFSFLFFHIISTFYGVRNHLGTMFSLTKMKQD